MPDFAVDHVSHSAFVDPNGRLSFVFGPPTPGALRAWLHAGEPLDPEDIPPLSEPQVTLPGLGSAGEGIARLVASGVRPGPGILARPPGGPGGSDARPLPVQAFHVEILDAAATVRASGSGSVDYDVPTPGPSPGPRSRWAIRITNNGQIRAAVDAHVLFHGRRPILTRDIDLEFLNQKLELLFNSSQPFRIAFENRQVGIQRVQFGTGPAREVPIIHSFVRLVVQEAWVEIYPSLGRLERDLGAHVFQEETSSYRLTLRATIHDGALALRATVDFVPSRGVIDVLSVLEALGQHVIAAIGNLFVDLTPVDRPVISIRSFALDLFLVLRPRGAGGFAPSFEVVARPKVDLEPSWASYVVDAMLQTAFERLLPESAGPAFHEIATDLLGWLLGERGREVTGNEEHLSIQYAGDAPPLGVGPVIFPSSPPTPLSPGNLSKIDHIVVIMMENRSFDHMLGFLSLPTAGNSGLIGLGRSDVEGLQGTETNPSDTRGGRQGVFSLAQPRQGAPLAPDKETRGTRFRFDPGHSFEATKAQRGDYDIVLSTPVIPGNKIDQLDTLDPRDHLPQRFHVGPNEGFVLNFALRLTGKVSAAEELILRGEVMGYHPAEHVPTYLFLAEQYGICDHWFAAHPGHTWPNRFVALTGRLAPGSDGQPQVNNPELSSFDPLELATIFDHLTAAGVDWRYYEHDFSMLRLFSKYTLDREHIVSVDDPDQGFYAAARLGTLPPVAFIEPDLTDIPPGSDDHPPADIQDGQALIKRIYDALVGGPVTQWQKTLLIIVYDEHGGFYDHVHPASKRIIDTSNPLGVRVLFAPLADDPATGEPIDHYGMRVPAFIASPWVPARSVSKVEYDHTSILKTIMARFLSQQPPDMGRRVALAADLGPLLSLAVPRLPILSPRVTFTPDRRLLASMRSGPPPDDFRAFLGGFRRRVRRA